LVKPLKLEHGTSLDFPRIPSQLTMGLLWTTQGDGKSRKS